jgi:hypothetical protein
MAIFRPRNGRMKGPAATCQSKRESRLQPDHSDPVTGGKRDKRRIAAIFFLLEEVGAAAPHRPPAPSPTAGRSCHVVVQHFMEALHAGFLRGKIGVCSGQPRDRQPSR